MNAGQVMDEQMIELAQAIEGPHLPVPSGSKFTLEQLRAVRWRNLTEQEQGCRLSEARAAHSVIAGKVAELTEALERINRRASPNPERTLDGCADELMLIADEARAALAPHPKARNEEDKL